MMNQNLKSYEPKRGPNQLRSGNRLYYHKKIKLNECKCSNAKCFASIFLLLILVGGQNVIADPSQIHAENCEEYPDEFFEHKEQLSKVKGLRYSNTLRMREK